VPVGPTPGERFGPYDILDVLGAGGMGVVFRARDTRLGREVAIKTLPPASAADPTRLQRFEAEARAASALNHPNVLAVFDVGREGETPYLVTELLQGETLRERLATGPLPVRKTIELAMQVAQGLAAVHEKGIVHRDLKPDNLFVTRDGQLKILDFGVARTIEGVTPATGTLPLTQSGAVMGTAGYMSPEQVRGRVADARSDLFALGAIIYECLSGQMAFPGETPVERGYAILNADPKTLSQIDAAALQRVMRRCLEKDPEQRFQHARDLLFALEAVTEGSGQSALVSAPLPERRSQVRSTLIGLGAFATGALGVFLLSPKPAHEPTASVPEVLKAPVSKRVSFRNGTILNARFTSDGRGVAYSGAFENTPPRVYSGVLDGAQLRSASGPGTMLFDVSEKDELALGGTTEESMQKGGLIFSRSSLAGGAARALYEGVLWADFGPNDALVLTRFADSRWTVEYPPGHVIVTSSHSLGQARLSPDGSMVAFARHPVVGDDRGTVEIVDRVGKTLATSTSAWTLEGLAWSPTGKEVWFSAGYDNVARQIHALALDGTQRLVYSGPGSIRLLDIDPKGRVLASTGIMRSRMFGKVASDMRERSLSWLDGSMPLDLSADGNALLFLEGFGPAGTEVQTWFRQFDQADDTPLLLSNGWGRALSPDKRWAVITPTPPFNTLRMVPTGVGTQRDLPSGKFLAISNVRFFPEGDRIVFSAIDTDNKPHLYVQSVLAAGIEAADAVPLKVSDEELWLAAPPSPDGKWLVGYSNKTKHAMLVPVDEDDGEPKVLDKLATGDLPVQWSPDGKQLWLMRRPKLNQDIGVGVLRYELATGKTTPVATIQPGDAVGMEHIKQGIVTPDGRHYVYTANQQLDELYLIEGVR
jgi:eukaryotic-like serine/threonine-protein kinase